LAKVTGPLFSVSASGRLGKDLIFESKRNGIVTCKKYASPKNKRTVDRLLQRDLYRYLKETWDLLTDEEKEKWSLKGESEGLNRWTAFLHHELGFPFFVVGKRAVGCFRIGRRTYVKI